MGRRQVIALSWIAVAALSVALTVIFRADTAQIVVTLALGVATLGLGVWMLLPGGDSAIRASVVAGAAWCAVYGILAILQADDMNALVTDVGLAALGAGLGLLARRSRVSGATVDPNQGFDPSRGR